MSSGDLPLPACRLLAGRGPFGPFRLLAAHDLDTPQTRQVGGNIGGNVADVAPLTGLARDVHADEQPDARHQSPRPLWSESTVDSAAFSAALAALSCSAFSLSESRS